MRAPLAGLASVDVPPAVLRAVASVEVFGRSAPVREVGPRPAVPPQSAQCSLPESSAAGGQSLSSLQAQASTASGREGATSESDVVQGIVHSVGGRLGRPASEVEKVMHTLRTHGVVSRLALARVDERAALCMHIPLRFVQALHDELQAVAGDGAGGPREGDGPVTSSPGGLRLLSSSSASASAPHLGRSSEDMKKEAASIERHLQRQQAARELKQQRDPASMLCARSEASGDLVRESSRCSGEGSFHMTGARTTGGMGGGSIMSPGRGRALRGLSPQRWPASPRCGSKTARLPGEVLARVRSPKKSGSASLPSAPRCVVTGRQASGSACLPIRGASGDVVSGVPSTQELQSLDAPTGSDEVSISGATGSAVTAAAPEEVTEQQPQQQQPQQQQEEQQEEQLQQEQQQEDEQQQQQQQRLQQQRQEHQEHQDRQQQQQRQEHQERQQQQQWQKHQELLQDQLQRSDEELQGANGLHVGSAGNISPTPRDVGEGGIDARAGDEVSGSGWECAEPLCEADDTPSPLLEVASEMLVPCSEAELAEGGGVVVIEAGMQRLVF